MKLFNSLTRQKEVFIPINENKINMYVCGMTVYDFCHIGHARVLVVFDMANRYFKQLGYTVNYIRNITDIDDKIIARANENNEDFNSLTERFISAMHEDETALKCLSPNEQPKATEYVGQMITHIQQLIEKGHAYPAKNGDVFYSVASFSDYGKLANQKLEELQAGQRVEVDANKKNPLDFVLWKSSKPEEPSWDSPWGKGRPGWHIECSAMSQHTLGNHFDIHGGGLDLKFPHHECEIAQSEPICGKKHVNYWMHNGFVQIDSDKMSKSKGNFFTIRDVLKNFSGEVIRFFIIGTHYRSPLNYSEAGLTEAKNSLERLYSTLRGIDTITISPNTLLDKYPVFFESMNDDFNSAKAVSELFIIAKHINKSDNTAEKQQLTSELKSLGGILGILQDNPDDFLQAVGSEAVDATTVEALIEQRNNARKNKDFATADEIRDKLTQMNIEIEDANGKTTWRVK